MGTNFYRKPILTKERKKKLHKLVEEEKLKSSWSNEGDPEDSVTNMIEFLTKGVHICKRSCGWYINFDHNWGKYYEPSRESLEKFLSEPGYRIEDEYGVVYTPEQFWKEVDEWNSTPSHDGSPKWTSKTYVEWELSRNPRYKYYPCTEDRNKVFSKWNIYCTSDDFEVDGLRFSVFSDFS